MVEKFSWEALDTYWFVDQINKMMLIQNPGWNLEGDNGRGDAIERSFLAFVLYGDPRFLDGIEACWEKVERKGIRRFIFGNYYYQGYRYPTHDHPVGLSRDHLTCTILAFKYAGYSDEFLKDFVTHLRWKISDFAMFTPDLWLWVRAIANIKPYTALFPPISWIAMKVSSIWNKALYKYTDFGEESSQNDFIKLQNSFKPKRIQKMAKKFYPIYSLHIQSWQYKLLKDSKWKKRLQKVSLEICPKHNYVIQLLLNSPNPPTQEQVEGYESMKGGRWTGILNSWINDRNIEVNKDKESLKYNVLDVDYVRKLYYTISCSDI